MDPCENCTDTIPPVFEGIETFIVGECGELSIEELGISATDNCGEVTITFEDIKFSPGCLGTIQRTYTATDICGNITTAIQIIDLTNENGPIMECPEDESFECITDVPAPVEPIVSHGCDLEIVSLELNETTEGDNCALVITREWTAMDACGGISTCVQTITVMDTTAPGVPDVVPGPLTVPCLDDIPAAEVLTAPDNCSGPITGVLEEEEVPGDCPNSLILTRTWTFTDACGNASALMQTITVEDTEAPTAPEVPMDLTVQCDEIPAPEVLTATDNCGDEIIGVLEEVETEGDCPNNFVLTRTWTFTDECGNVSQSTQTITVEDTEAPIAPTNLEDIQVQCAADVPAAEVLTATDNCSDPITGVLEEVETAGDCPNSFVLTRTWTFTDECGNVSQSTQTIIVEDTEAPNAPANPEDVQVQCATDVPAPVTLTATDNCSDPITGVLIEEGIAGDCPNNFVITRTWIFTDECGNVSQSTQTVTVEDTEAPNAPANPEDVQAQCATDVPAAVVLTACLLYTSPSPRDATLSRMPSSA